MGNIPYKDGYMDAVVQIKRLTDRNADLEADLAEARERAALAEADLTRLTEAVEDAHKRLEGYVGWTDRPAFAVEEAFRILEDALAADRPPQPEANDACACGGRFVVYDASCNNCGAQKEPAHD